MRPLAVGRREWIPSCSANLQISLETDGNGGTFEWVFRNWFGFFCDAAEEWLDQAERVHLGSLAKQSRNAGRRTKRAMVCKNEALDVVKTVTHKRGFESWRKLCMEFGSATGTSLHEYTNLLECDFGTTDGFKKKLLKWENQIVDFQKATGEVFSDRLECAIVLSRSPGPIRTYLRVQNRGDHAARRKASMNYLEAEDDGHGPVPMEVGAMKGKKGDKGKKGHGKGKYCKNNEYSKNNEYGKGSEKGKEKGKKGKGKGQGKDEKPAPNSSFQGYCRSCGGTSRASVGKVTCKPRRKFRVLPRVQWRRFKRSMMRMNQNGSSA